MTESLENVFSPGTNVEVVFNLNSLSPVTRPSLIFDTRSKKKEFIVAQTTPKILPNFQFEEMHITTLVTGELARKTRYGIRCSIQGFETDYKLGNDNTTDVVIVRHEAKLSEVNIRSAFRLTPTKKFSVIGKLLHNGQQYYSGTDFSILDISLTGLGILVPKKVEGNRNPLLQMECGKAATIGLALKYTVDENVVLEKIAAAVRIVRINPNYSDKAMLCGVRFMKVKAEHEEAMNHFIHEAQLEQIRQLNRY